MCMLIRSCICCPVTRIPGVRKVAGKSVRYCIARDGKHACMALGTTYLFCGRQTDIISNQLEEPEGSSFIPIMIYMRGVVYEMHRWKIGKNTGRNMLGSMAAQRHIRIGQMDIRLTSYFPSIYLSIARQTQIKCHCLAQSCSATVQISVGRTRMRRRCQKEMWEGDVRNRSRCNSTQINPKSNQDYRQEQLTVLHTASTAQ